MRKAEKGGLVLVGLGIIDKGLDLLARAGGIHADTPDLFNSMWRMMSDIFGFLGFSGIAIIVGAGIFAWGRWGDRIRQWLPTSMSHASPDSVPATHEDLIKVVHALAESSEFASEIADLSRKTAVEEIRTLLLRDVKPKIDDAQSRLEQNDRDISALLYYALYSINLRILRDLLAAAPKVELYYEKPDITLEWINEQRCIADDFVKRTKKVLAPAHRVDRFLSVIANAENEADHEVRQMPTERRPKGIDPFELRLYVISTNRCRKAIMFLAQEEMDMIEQIASQREAIQERYSLKSP